MAANTKADLTRMNRAAANAQFGDLVAELIAASNAQNTALKAIAAKLDTDGGVTAADFASAITASLPADIKKLEDR